MNGMLPHCEPTGNFLRLVSIALNACVPTPLALVSTLLGGLSIVSWLFAQLPQIFKNYRLQSTSGLSIYFLVEWCLGDVSNLCGAILTGQARWQVIIGAYYCLVDFMLVWQWLWYEHLKHGRPMKRIWKSRFRISYVDDTRDTQQMAEDGNRRIQDSSGRVYGPASSSKDGSDRTVSDRRFSGSSKPCSSPLTSGQRSASMQIAKKHAIHRSQSYSVLAPSPKTLLLTSMLIAIVQASSSSSAPAQTINKNGTLSAGAFVGSVLAWLSTVLYLFSRLPQLIQNQRRRSTAGLSLTLFVAAFLGNLFYSSSLLCNPQAWKSYPPYGCHGWVGERASQRQEWLMNAAPFWLGAAGVLIMDAAVAIQFWYFGSNNQTREILVAVQKETSRSSWRWREVKGWMRGWKPSVSNTSGRNTPSNEEEALLIRNAQDIETGS